MIYLFCNTEYGNAFLREFLRYDNLKESEKCIVFTGNHVKVIGKGLGRAYSYIMNAKGILKSRIKEVVLTMKYGVKVLCINNVNSNVFRLRIQEEDYGIIAGFNQIFKGETIQCFQSLVNFHPSLLPFYKGPVPSYWCIQNGERYTGFTLHTVTTKIDGGEILYQGGIIEIGSITDAAILDQRIAQSASRVMVMYLDNLLGKSEWERKIVDVKDIYKCNVEYASFPKES